MFFFLRENWEEFGLLKNQRGKSRVNAEWQDVDDVDGYDMLHIGGGEYLNRPWIKMFILSGDESKGKIMFGKRQQPNN